MKIEITYVPEDKCPLNILSELGTRTESAWIYFHTSCVEKLKKSCEDIVYCNDNYIQLTWPATESYPELMMIIHENNSSWMEVTQIEADNIAFKKPASDPKENFFLRMAE